MKTLTEAVNTMIRFLLKWRAPLVLAFNLFLTAVTLFLALGLRFDFDLTGRTLGLFVILPFSLLGLFRTATYVYFGLNRGYWRYVSTNEAVTMFKAHLLASLLFAAALGLLRLDSFPRSVIFIEFTLSLLFSMGARLGVRLLCERLIAKRQVKSGSAKEVVVIGGGISGHLLVKTLLTQRHLRYIPVAVFDDRQSLRGGPVHGVPIVGEISSLKEYLEQHSRVTAVIVAIPNLSETKLEQISQVCDNLHIPLKRLQSFEDIACQEIAEPSTALTVEQVLCCESEVEHELRIREEISGKRVLITGAGGSIGSELVRQVLTFDPAELVLVDRNEYNLFQIEREICNLRPHIKKAYRLADVTNEGRIKRIFRDYRPQLVFHTAAYKHVPLLEANCYEAFRNNIIGTKTVLEVARDAGAERFVLISTDKAVDPSSVMGCTKRVAELMVQDVTRLGLEPEIESSVNGQNGSHKGAGRMSTGAVRFGNVINSAGSVVPVFKRQILSGGPVTVTHADMERYFMSIREAVHLVLTAGTLGERGEIYLLDMGKPIKIVEVAKKLLALYGRRDIPIVFTGLRPGEKLTERLFSDNENRVKTRFNKIFVLRYKTPVVADVFSWVEEVKQQIEHLSEVQIEAAVRMFVSAIDKGLTDHSDNKRRAEEQRHTLPEPADNISAGDLTASAGYREDRKVVNG